MSAASLLLITALTIPTNMLVLRSGERIGVEGTITVEDRRVLFRSGGGFYSVASDEVDFTATREAGEPAAFPIAARGKLRVTPEERDRLLRDLEQNHSGTAAPANALEVPPGPSPSERRQAMRDEWSWKREARGYEEAIRRAREAADLLRDRAEELKAHITGLLALGYKPEQFSYDTTQLAYTIDQIPQAELEVQRAQRAYDQFRDDARRQDVTPGWLR
jgi:hypothetical protein